MKKLILMILLLAGRNAFSQNRLKADQAINHIGEIVTIQDSIYSGRVFKDSIAVFNMGFKNNTSPLTLIVYGKVKPGDEPKLIHSLQVSKISFTGLVLMTLQGPLIIVKNPGELSLNQFAR